MIDALLRRHKLRVTPVRRAVLAQLLDRRAAVAQSELTADTDRITLYRTLKTFEECGLIHRIVDTQGVTRYALCGEGCTTEAHHDVHPHFACSVCAQTFCLPDVAAPELVLPKGYRLAESRVTLLGHCPACAETLPA